MEMYQGLPVFTCLKENQPVKTYTKLVQCGNLNHKAYNQEFAVYKDGTQAQISFCPECMNEKQKKEEARLKREIEEENIRLCKECNVEPEYYNKTLDDYIPKTESQKRALEGVKKLLSGDIKKLVLIGDYGTGKSMLGNIAVKETGGKIYSMYEISTMIRQSYTVKAVKSELEIVNELAAIPGVFVLDEMGRSKNSEFNQNWMSYVFDKRHVRNLPFILIKNGHLRKSCPDNGCPDCFENCIDGDVISRLRQNSEIIEIHGDDFRKNK